MIFEDDVPTVSLSGDQAANIRAWCQDNTLGPAPRPRLTRVDRARVRLSNVLATLSLWVLP